MSMEGLHGGRKSYVENLFKNSRNKEVFIQIYCLLFIYFCPGLTGLRMMILV